MKSKLLITLTILTALFVSCDKIDELLTFTISHQTTFTIPGTPVISTPLDILLPDITTNSAQEFSNKNTTADLVKDVKLEELKLSITNPANQTFKFIESIHIFISADGYDEIELAYMDNIPTTAASIDLITTDEKLDNYIKASNYKLRTAIILREATNEDVDIQTDLKFKITADPL